MKHQIVLPQRGAVLLCKYCCMVVMLISCCILMQSCAYTQNQDVFVSALGDLKQAFVGKSKNYIIEHFPHPINDIKYLDDQYEILICRRYRVVGTGITRFYIKNGICYNIETNEYNIEQRRVKVSWF